VAASRLSPALRQRLDASDIVQEVFERLFRYIARRDVSFATEQEFLGFLYQFTKNRLLKRAKAELAAKRDLRCETACEESPDCVAPTALGVECQELLGVIREAVAKQFGEGSCLELIMGRSNRQIAREFDICTKTVGRRMRRIWKAIRAYDPSLEPRTQKRNSPRKPR
jgi:DNA-directed RNA polymerase specialized sigma24 family protein